MAHYRCSVMEKLLESITIPCDNASYGCSKVVKYCEKHAHQKSCVFEPCLCPQVGCNFLHNSNALALHFKENHVLGKSSFRYGEVFTISLHFDEDVVIFQAQTDDQLFVINNKVETTGNHVNLWHIGPNTPNPIFRFKMSVISPQGDNILTLQSEAKNIQGRTFSSSSSSLLVPPEFFQPSGQILLQICINTESMIHGPEELYYDQRLRCKGKRYRKIFDVFPL